MSTTSDQFPTDTSGLPEARPPELVELSHGDRFDLRIAPVAKRLGDATVRMLGYNGSIPGPVLEFLECMAEQGYEVQSPTEIHAAPPQVLQACFESLHQGGGSR
jgi:hypothetical protein